MRAVNRSSQPRRDPLVWLDLSNSPNVLFCRPLIAELESRGYRTVVTIRDFAQTKPLCDLYGLPYMLIGGHGGRSLAGKAGNLAARAQALLRFARATRPDLALTHNSYSQLIVTRLLRIPAVTSMDYEFQPANHLAFRCADRVFVPRAFPDAVLRRQGAPSRKVWKYPGLKEDISLAGFTPLPGYRESHGWPATRPLVVVRPPATFALYHRFENRLFPSLLERLKSAADCTTVVLPRTPAQAADLQAGGYGDLLWHAEALDGPNLATAADLVVSGGGSMVREAAVLGTPAYSIYAGKLAGIDNELLATGRLRLLRTEDDVSALPLEVKAQGPTETVGDRLASEFVDHVENAWNSCRRRDTGATRLS